MLELSLHIDAAVMVSNTLSNGLFQCLSGSAPARRKAVLNGARRLRAMERGQACAQVRRVAAVIEKRSLLIFEKQREVLPWNVTPAGQPPDKVGKRTRPAPESRLHGTRFRSISDWSGGLAHQEVIMLTITIETARRFILGKQGLWPGRRWRGSAGTEAAMQSMEYLQLDPLQIIARSQDIALHSRVLDYTPGMWEDLTYQQRKFFDWGAGWPCGRWTSFRTGAWSCAASAMVTMATRAFAAWRANTPRRSRRCETFCVSAAP